MDDAYAASGLREWVDSHDLGVAFFSPLKHGLLLGKYDTPAKFPEGDFRARIPEFGDATALNRLRRAVDSVRERYEEHPEPVMHALVGSLLADAPTGCVLIGQRNIRQVVAASYVGDPISATDARWVRNQYRA